MEEKAERKKVEVRRDWIQKGKLTELPLACRDPKQDSAGAIKKLM